jgi:hypothetical protein
VNNELDRVWKEAVMALFEVLSWHLPEGLRKTTKDLGQNSWSPGRDLNPGPPEYKGGVFTS